MNWISVEDRLPKLLEKVLFFWVMDDMVKNIAMGYLCDKGWDIYFPYASFQIGNSCIKVTHWMPLPDYPSDKNAAVSQSSKSATSLGGDAWPSPPRMIFEKVEDDCQCAGANGLGECNCKNEIRDLILKTTNQKWEFTYENSYGAKRNGTCNTHLSLPDMINKIRQDGGKNIVITDKTIFFVDDE